MDWIYLSPHLDDAVFSCGGLIWQQVQHGDRVEIWTLCAGDPPDRVFSPFAQELHARWQAGEESIAGRHREDQTACAAVGALPRYFPLPDCIYRRAGLDYWSHPAEAESGERAESSGRAAFLYPDRDSIFGPINPAEIDLVDQLAAHLAAQLPSGARLVSPIAIGGHADHRLARHAAERLNAKPWYYADYPYAADHFDQIEACLPSVWRKQSTPLSAEAFAAWAAGVAAYRTQISSFWADLEQMHASLLDYSVRLNGSVLWSSTSNSNIVRTA